MSAPSLPSCFRNYPGIVVHLDADGRILDSNGRLEALYEGEIQGHPLAEFLDDSSSGEKWERLLAQAGRGEQETARTWEFVLRGVETLEEPRGFSALWDEDGECIWLIEHQRDPRLEGLRTQVVETNTELSHTQRELLKERSELAVALSELEAEQRTTRQLMETVREQNIELQRSNRALDDFAHAISHDLKAPLRSIGRYAEFLREDLGDRVDEESSMYLGRLQDRVNRLKAMIDGVLEFSRIGRHREDPEPVDVGALVDHIADLLDVQGRVAIEHADLPHLVTEIPPLQQVLLNLISNGVRYAEGPTPTVRIDARREGDFHHFRVSDTGPGVPELVRDRIWNLFQTLDPDASSTESTGIGLAIVKRQVEEMGGEVWVDSEAGGATFHFTWPATQGAGNDTTTAPTGDSVAIDRTTSG